MDSNPIITDIVQLNEVINEKWLHEKLKNVVDRDTILKELTFPLMGVLIKFTIKNAPPEVAQSIHKFCTVERHSHAINLERDLIMTDDESMNQEELCENINNIPLRYDLTEEEAETIILSIDIKNDSNGIMWVMAGDMLTNKGSKPRQHILFPSTRLISLQPGKQLKIDNIKIVKGNAKGMSLENCNAKFQTACQGSIWPLDRHDHSKESIEKAKRLREIQNNIDKDHINIMNSENDNEVEKIRKGINKLELERINLEKDLSKTVKTSNITPLYHEIRFRVNCVLKDDTNVAKKIINSSLDEIIQKLRDLLDIVKRNDQIYVNTSLDVLTLNINETNAIGKMLERKIYDFYKDEIDCVSSELLYHTDVTTIRIKAGSPKKILENTLEKMIQQYLNLKI